MKRKTESDPLLNELVATLSRYHSTLVMNVLPPSEAVPADELRADNEETCVWLTVKASTRAYGKWVVGLELLALLAYVDWKLWVQQVMAMWPVSLWREWSLEPSFVGIEIGVSVQGRFEPPFKWLALSSMPHAQLQELVKARELVRKLLERRGEVVTHVPVRLVYHPGERLGMSMFHIMQLVLTQRHLSELVQGLSASTCDTSRDCSYSGLRIESIRTLPSPSSHPTAKVDASALQYMAVMVNAGVAVHSIGILRDGVESHVPHELVRALWKLLGVGETDPDVCRRCVHELPVRFSYSPRQIRGLLSAFSASGSLCAAAIVADGEASHERREFAWKWIAYALFCGLPGRIQCEKVTLDVSTFDEDDLQHMQRVVAAVDPLAELVEREPRLARMAISAARFCLSDPSRKGSTSVVCDRVLHDLCVLKQSKVWTMVLLPGWGEAWVHQNDIAATSQRDTGPFEIRSIPRVILTELVAATKPAVFKLVGLIGAGIRHLALHGVLHNRDQSFFRIETWADTIFVACPQLMSLEIERLETTSFDFLLNGYTSGKCRLATFKVNQSAKIADHSMIALMHALSDERHPATRHLRELVVYPVEAQPTITSELQEAAVAMLNQNKLLDLFDMRFNPGAVHQHVRAKCEEAFEGFHGELISRAQAPLGIRQRLALLSVLRPRQGKQTTRSSSHRNRAIEALDGNVLSLVFNMAAPCMRRRVYVGKITNDSRWL